MDKRERVIRSLELEEPDLVPIHSLGYDRTRGAYRDFMNSPMKNKYHRVIDGIGDITEICWWDADIWQLHPFEVFSKETYPSPPGHENCDLHITGRLFQKFENSSDDPLEVAGHIPWYEGGYFTSKEIVHEYWAEHGKPIDFLNPGETYSAKKWARFVEALAPYTYPMAWLTLSMHEALYEGLTPARMAYYMRKEPSFIHELMHEYCRVNIEVSNRFAEAGVDIVFYSDDLGQHGRSILSKKQFREFIYPYYKKLYDNCRKRGMLTVQHSCGYVIGLLDDLIDAGLSCLQSIEPTAGMDLKTIKEQYGNRIAFMGGMDSSRILTFGTVSEVVNNVKECINVAARGGGYFAGPSHTILDTPWENIIAFRQAITKYRKT